MSIVNFPTKPAISPVAFALVIVEFALVAWIVPISKAPTSPPAVTLIVPALALPKVMLTFSVKLVDNFEVEPVSAPITPPVTLLSFKFVILALFTNTFEITELSASPVKAPA